LPSEYRIETSVFSSTHYSGANVLEKMTDEPMPLVQPGKESSDSEMQVESKELSLFEKPDSDAKDSEEKTSEPLKWTTDPAVYFIDEKIKTCPPPKELTPEEGAAILGRVSEGQTFVPVYHSEYRGDHYAPAPGMPGEQIDDKNLDSWVLNHLPQTCSFQIDIEKFLPDFLKGKSIQEIRDYFYAGVDEQEDEKIMDVFRERQAELKQIRRKCAEEQEKNRIEIQEAIKLAAVDQRKESLSRQREKKVRETGKEHKKSTFRRKDVTGTHIVKTPHGTFSAEMLKPSARPRRLGPKESAPSS